MNIKKILGVLPSLSPKHLQTIRDRIGFLLSEKGSDEVNGIVPEEELFYMAMKSAINKVVFEGAPSYSVFARTNVYPQFLEKVKIPIKFAKANLNHDSRSDRMKFYRVVADLVVKDIQNRWSAPKICMKTVTSSLSSIPEIFEQQFPRYIECGIVSKMIGMISHNER